MFKLEIEPSETLHTKFGNVNINNMGYYVITTRKEGNNMKLLHRLIWEKYYGEISLNIHIHHVDGNKLNNCIWNLDTLTHSEHSSLHNKGKEYSDETKMKMSEAKKGENNPFYNNHHSDETKIKMSKARNTTGYFRVIKHKCLDCKQGYGVTNIMRMEK